MFCLVTHKYWVNCWVKMMSLRHDWDWQPPQTASHIHIRHIKNVWAHWYAVHGHKVAAIHSYTHTTWLRFWGSGSLVWSKWCHYVMVEADSHLKLLPTSTLEIETVWANSYAVYRHMVVATNSYTHTTWLILWGSGSLVESKWCHYVMVDTDRHLSHCFPHPFGHIQSVWAHWCAVHGHTAAALNSYTYTTWLIFWGSGSLVELKWYHYVMVEADSQVNLLPVSTLDIYQVFEHIHMLSMGIWQ